MIGRWTFDESRYGALPNLGGVGSVPAVGLGAWEEIRSRALAGHMRE